MVGWSVEVIEGLAGPDLVWRCRVARIRDATQCTGEGNSFSIRVSDLNDRRAHR